MKKKLAVFALIAVLMMALFVACACDDTTPPDPVISVRADGDSISLRDSKVENYDYTKLFTILKDGVNVTVEKSYLDLSAVSATETSFTVTCTYEGNTASIVVNVVQTVYLVELSKTEITIRQGEVSNYDFKALFTVTTDGVKQTLTDSMIESNVVDEVGEYTYTVTNATASATLKITVIPAHEVLVVPAYKTLNVQQSQLATFDPTSLFSLYCDSQITKVTADMVDASALVDAQVGNTYTVNFAYNYYGLDCSASVQVAVVDDIQTTVTTKTVETYPNDKYIDLTTLFEVKHGTESIAVTNDMISGTIDYSTDGDNIITLHYDGVDYTSTVVVRRGVVIDYTTSDVINIKRGTEKSTYLFGEDFIVIVNGIRYRDIDQFIAKDDVDFNTNGSYEVTLKVPYNENGVSLSGAKFSYYEKTITYNVLDVEYTVSVANDLVTLPLGTTSYNVLNNIQLVRNGYSCTVTSHQDWVNIITCYGEVTSDPINFDSLEKQLVTVDLYVYATKAGEPLGQPVTVSFYVQVVGDVTIEGSDTAVLPNSTFYTTSLFTVTADGNNVEVTSDMVSGKVDVFTPGTYEVTCEYEGVSLTVKVVVINPELIGTFKTAMGQFPTEDDDDTSDTDDEDYSSWYNYRANASTRSSTLGDLVISADGTITVHGVQATFVGAIDGNTVLIKIGSNEHTLYYENGIIILDPDNSLKLGFNELKRPLVYFNPNMWDIGEYVQINYSSQDVLLSTSINHTYYATHITSVDGTESLWYALKTALVSKTSADTIYEVSWGEITFSDSFELTSGASATLTFGNTTEKFNMTSDTVGKIDNTKGTKIWANKTFYGTLNGESATISFDSYENSTIRVGSTVIVSASSTDYDNYMKNGGVDHDNKTLFIYFSEGSDKTICSYKFKLDDSNYTFTYVEQDGYFGKYVNGSMYVFLDGYGTGVANFNISSYVTYQLKYTVQNGEVKIIFINTISTFEYGEYMTFHIADLKNVLTTKYTVQNALYGTWTNQYIVDGAIVTFTSERVHSGTDCKKDIVNGITITTKDGELTYEQKTAKTNGVTVVDTSSVSINQDGFYQIKVNISVNGSIVQSLYSVQVVTPKYSDQAMATTFGTGTINSAYSLTFDVYGTAMLYAGNVLYTGYVKFLDNNAFTAKAFSESGTSVLLNGNLVADGVLYVRSSGAISFTDYFTVGTKQVAGNDDYVLRKIGANETIYIFATSATSLGEIVTVSIDESNSDIITVQRQNGTNLVFKVTWGTSATKGLVLSDSLRGTYTSEDGSTLVVDGFGNAKVDNISGTYTANGTNISFISDSLVAGYAINVADGTFTNLNVALDETLVAGKTFTLTYNFSDDDSSYSATTSFQFLEGGKVIITSTSDDYEEDNGTYSPSFASKTGAEGTFLVEKNKIIVKINNETFAFSTTNVIQCVVITVESTTLSQNAVGAFVVGATFSSLA